MGKKRKSRQPQGPTGPREVDPAEARLTVRTYEDVADSEDEYHMDRDRILLEDEPHSKRLKRQDEEDAFLEPSDEEVLYESADEEDDEEEQEVDTKAKSKHATKATMRKGVLSDEEPEDEEEQDEGYWGSSKKEYYNADAIQTEADAMEEEAEALRLQKNKLQKMSEADFIFDEDEWRAPETEAGEDTVVTEVLKEVEVTDDMGPEERSRLLQTLYPELGHLLDEFEELQPQLEICQKEAEGKPAKSLEVVKHWVLGCYVAALSSYVAILTSSSEITPKLLNPSELRDHEIMETLVTCREAWLKVKNLRSAKVANGVSEIPSPISDTDLISQKPSSKQAIQKTKKTAVNGDNALEKKRKRAAEKERRAKAEEIEASLADLSGLLAKPKGKKAKAVVAARPDGEDDRSDFGEEEMLDARTAADKAAKKKSLRFYTSQIVQKSNRRADAGRDAGGDMDIPYRERFRDRQARLNAEAERRGRQDSKHGAALGEGDSSDEDEGKGQAGNDEDYYDMAASASRKKKEDKASRYDALAAAGKAGRVVEKEEIGEDGKRRISYQIQANKGLAPKRKKENRNGRVKKRRKYEEKQKKLSSIRAVYKGSQGPYQGETTGIKTGLIKSIKL